ncbi:MAG: ATP-binding protein [Acidobacteria bacterium]|nr:ATP-binding protein [Acidobacteriota bacterium]
MNELKRQLIGALIVIMTVAVVLAAAVNFQQQNKYELPEDGVTWVDRSTPLHPKAVIALHIAPGSPGDKFGIREGDVLRRIGTLPVENAIDVAQILVGSGAWKKLDYFVERIVIRQGVAVALDTKLALVVEARTAGSAVLYQYAVGAAYLFIGLFVFFRRGSAHRAVHFYLLCLASFVLNTFHYTGKLNNFDKVIYYCNVFAGLFLPTLFFHFSVAFPEPARPFRARWVRVALYAPAVVLSVLWVLITASVLRLDVSLIELRWMMDRIWLLFVVSGQIAGAIVLALRYPRAEDPIVRQQLKWLRNGAVLGVLPFTLLYALPFALGAIPSARMEMAVLALVFVPITWAYAIFRYRLMDVDVIFQQGYVYTLATLGVLAVFYGLLVSITAGRPSGPNSVPGAENSSGRFDDLSPVALVVLILVAAFVFQPIRNWLQEILDRYVFYRDRYDYRRTLIEFARELSAETDLNRMLSSVSDRLLRTLSIQHLAFFLSDEKQSETFRMYMTAGLTRPVPDVMDLTFLSSEMARETPYLFFERTRNFIDVLAREWPASVKHTISDLGLTYYIPCTSRGRVIAWLGVSRTDKGDFLSSDDVELLVTLGGYVGIAVENARLYRSLERKAEEVERLKEFSENIVESINVGILAVDLDDRVESWNTQMEHLTGIRRQDAVDRRLRELLPVTLSDELIRHRGDPGIHHIYKAALTDRIVNIAVAPLISKEQEQIGRLIIFDDITERSELETRLVQADKLSSIGLLAAGVAHEVNTPLAVISTYAQMLAKQVNGDEAKSRMLEKIAKQTFRASEIVNSLLNFSRTGSTEFEDVDLNRVLRETLSLIEPQLQKSQVRVLHCFEPNLRPIRGNSSKLQQVFLNLFLNARDAMESGGVLEVKTSLEAAAVRVEVLDSGQGISADLLSRIYDPFFTTKGAQKGTGLGLSITYGIVKEHGGSIVADSTPGQGTCFTLAFPLVPKTVKEPLNALRP